MVAKKYLTDDAYQRQIAPLQYSESKGDQAKKYPITVKVNAEMRDKLKAVPNWPDKLRDAIAQLIEAES